LPLLVRIPAGLHATGVHCPAPVQLVPLGQRVMLAMPPAAQVLMVLAVAQVVAPGVQLGATQLATPATTPQLPPITAQSCGASATPAPSQRCSRLPLQLAVLGVQLVDPTCPVSDGLTGRLGLVVSVLAGEQPTAPGVHPGMLLVPAAPGSVLLVPPTPEGVVPGEKPGTSSAPPSLLPPQAMTAAVASPSSDSIAGERVCVAGRPDACGESVRSEFTFMEAA
jgi:hypothetical protein